MKATMKVFSERLGRVDISGFMSFRPAQRGEIPEEVACKRPFQGFLAPIVARNDMYQGDFDKCQQNLDFTNLKRRTGRWAWPVSSVKAAILGLVLLLLLSGPALAQGPDAEVDFYLAPEETEQSLTVGDHITLRLEVKHPAGSQVVLPQLQREWQPFEVVEQTPPETIENGDGTATTGKEIIVTLFEPGQYLTPRLVVTHRPQDGSVEELAAPVISLNVTSVLTEDMELRDLKPQAMMAVPPLWPWVVGGLLLTILVTGSLAGAGLWVYHRWFRKSAPVDFPAPIIDTRPPELIAHAELDRIEALALPAQNRIKEHYSLVSDCLRQYIEGRYQIPALEQTSQELRTAFRRSNVAMPDVAGFMGILSESDLVKFARYRPGSDDVDNLVDRARTVVDTTTPPPEPAEMNRPESEVVL